MTRTKNEKRWFGWHFLPDDGYMRRDKSEKVKAGKWYHAEGIVRLCNNGMHASEKLLDALKWAPGSIVCWVELRGEILNASDKSCARSRKVIKKADATKVLHEFACWCAERSLKRERKAGREPDKRSWDAIKVKKAWLDGRANDGELGAARAAAWGVAGDAARNDARAAARCAARYAARAAAWADAWAKECESLELKLSKMVNGLLFGEKAK